MKVVMTNEELMNLFNTLGTVTTNQPAIKFKYAVAKTRQNLEPHAKALMAALQYPDPQGLLEEYNNKVQEITRKYSVDDDGKPNVRRHPQTGQLQREVPIKNLSAHAAEIEELRDVYAGLFKDTEDHRKKGEALLDEKIEVEVHAFRLSDIPGDVNQNILNQIIAFTIDDTPEEKKADLKSIK